MGFRIFMHSVRLVFTQLGGALRISGLLYLAAMAISIAAAFVFPPVQVGDEPPTFTWQFIVAVIASGIFYLWIAVGWHRFVLLDELPSGPLPAFYGDRVVAYFGRFVQAGLIALVVGLAFGLAIALVSLASSGSPFLALPVALLMLVVLLLISYRLSPLFPGAATGRSIGVGASWAATSGASGTFIVLAIVSGIASIIIDLPTLVFDRMPSGHILTMVWTVITGWIKLMVGVSVMTTIYGVYVEKRAIA